MSRTREPRETHFAVSFLIVGAATTDVSLAQEQPPPDVVPLAGEITLRLNPEFESHCTISKFDKEMGAAKERKSIVNSITRLFEDGLVSKMAISINVDKFFLRVSVPLNKERSGMDAPSQATIETDLPVNSPETLAVKQVMVAMLKKAGSYPTRGKSLKQGDVISAQEICELLPKGKTVAQKGSSSLLGLAQIKGRQSAVFGGEESVTCLVDGQPVRFQGKGWNAFDLESGLQIASSLKSTIDAVDGRSESTENLDCKISGA